MHNVANKIRKVTRSGFRGVQPAGITVSGRIWELEIELFDPAYKERGGATGRPRPIVKPRAAAEGPPGGSLTLLTSFSFKPCSQFRLAVNLRCSL